MRAVKLAALLAAVALMLAGCRFAVVESGYVRIESPANATQP